MLNKGVITSAALKGMGARGSRTVSGWEEDGGDRGIRVDNGGQTGNTA